LSRHLRRLLRALRTIGLCVLAAEFGAAMYLVGTEGRVPWFGQPRRAGPAQVLKNDPYRLRLNPHYGYMGRPGMRLADVTERPDVVETGFGRAFMERDYPTIAMNNHGFLSKYDYPYADPTGRAFVIGMFGSSIAIQLALGMEDEFNELLTRDPRLAGRRVVLLHFANGGTKQPQNATALAYFLSMGQKFDYIVNFDGFPELFIGWYNANAHATDERMPFARFIFGVQNVMLETHGALVGDDRIAHARGRLDQIERQRATRQFALRALWLAVERQQLTDRLEELEKVLSGVKAKENTTAQEAVTLAMPLLSRTTKDETASRELVVATWFNGSIAMAGMARGFGIPYLHVLQPNQYFTKAHFTEEQRAKFLNLTYPPVKELVPAYYRRYLERGREFPAHGVDFLDATGIFDDRDGSVFLDHCCHLSQAGNRILAPALARRILAGLDRIKAK
jgi:hypothetical protein